ncbi:MAG: SpaA isopeptide-forming pilin-related protein [Clostridiales bacterium]|nr:SpaA isopeptide-forming pilin-related protein [Clostridiales bacterium]
MNRIRTIRIALLLVVAACALLLLPTGGSASSLAASAEPLGGNGQPAQAQTGYLTVTIQSMDGAPITLSGNADECGFWLVDSEEYPASDHVVPGTGRFGLSSWDNGNAGPTTDAIRVPAGDYYINLLTPPAGYVLPNDVYIPVTVTENDAADDPVDVTATYLADPNAADGSSFMIAPLGLSGITGGASGTPIAYLSDGTPIWQHAIYPAGVADASPDGITTFCTQHGLQNPNGTSYTDAGSAPSGKILSALCYLNSDYKIIQGAYWRALGQYSAGKDSAVDAAYNAAAAFVDGEGSSSTPADNTPGFSWSDGAKFAPNKTVAISGVQYFQYGPFSITGATRGVWAESLLPGWKIGNSNGSAFYDPAKINPDSGAIPQMFYVYAPVSNVNGVKIKLYGGYNGATTFMRSISNGSYWVTANAQNLATCGSVTDGASTSTQNVSRTMEFLALFDVNFQKKDFVTGAAAQGDGTFEGAVYGLYSAAANGSYAKDQLVLSAKTGATGKAAFNRVLWGQYYIKEITASAGYMLNTGAIPINPDTMADANYAVSADGTEVVQKQAIEFRKLKLDEESDVIAPISGVGFSVYLISDLSKVKGGEIVKPSGGWQASRFADYFRDREVSGETRAKADGVVTPEYFSDADGLVKTAELPYGDYLIAETTPNPAYAKIAPFIVQITRDASQDPTATAGEPRPPVRPAGLYGGMLDQYLEMPLGVVKIDRDTGRGVFKDAAFKIWNVDKNEWVTQKVTYPTIITYGTDENPYRIDPQTGFLILPQPVAVGTYRIVETEAPSGYVLPEADAADTGGYCDHEGDGKLYTPDRASYTPAPANGVTVVIGSDEAVWNDALGAFVVYGTIEDAPQKGHLNIHKDKELPLDDQMESRDDPAAKFSDSPVKWTRHSAGWQTAPMEGAAFKLFAKEDILTQDGHAAVLYAADSEIPVYLEKDSVYTAKPPAGSGSPVSIATDANGNAAVKMLPIGKYMLKEISVSPDDMRQTGDGVFYGAYTVGYEKEIAVTGADDTAKMDEKSVWYQENPFVFVNVKPLNIWNLGRICLHKEGDAPQAPYIDENGNIRFPYEKEPLENVEFEVIANADITDINTGETIYRKGAAVAVIVTDENGNACVRDLIPGDYILHEKTPPNGYLPVADRVFAISERNSHDDDFSFMTWDLTDVYRKNSIGVEKTDRLTGRLLAGAAFGLYAAEDIRTGPPMDSAALGNPVIEAGTLIQTAATGENGKAVFMNLPEGKYTVREIKAPDGFLVNLLWAPEVTLAYGGNDEIPFTETLRCMDEAGPATPLKASVPETPAPAEMPKTADGFPLLPALIVLSLAIAGLLALHFTWRRKRHAG